MCVQVLPNQIAAAGFWQSAAVKRVRCRIFLSESVWGNLPGLPKHILRECALFVSIKWGTYFESKMWNASLPKRPRLTLCSLASLVWPSCSVGWALFYSSHVITNFPRNDQTYKYVFQRPFILSVYLWLACNGILLNRSLLVHNIYPQAPSSLERASGLCLGVSVYLWLACNGILLNRLCKPTLLHAYGGGRGALELLQLQPII